MSSAKQIAANGRNALKSTGPTTENGKAISCLNAVKHGLLSQEALMPGEDKEALAELARSLQEELNPVGQVEEFLVDRMTATAWRLRRLLRVEVGMFIYRMTDLFGNTKKGKPADLGDAFITDATRADAFSKLTRYESLLERGYFRSLHELQRLQAARAGQAVPLPVAAEIDLIITPDAA